MQTPPRPPVAFLFTDLEGSTRLWRVYSDRMPAAYDRHDAILRQAVTAHGGVIYKTIGDAIQAAFPTTAQAVAAAAEAQRTLLESLWPIPEPIRVRIALHAGDVTPDENGDYRSPVLNRLGRLLDAAHGGQVLISEQAVELIAHEGLPPRTGLRDMGRHRLKDLGRSERLYQLTGPGLPVAFPRPRTAASPWTGVVSAVALALAIVLLSPLATGASDLGPSLLAPRSIFENLTGMVITLAALRDHVLLAGTVGCAVVTLLTVLIWWRGARVGPGSSSGLLHLTGRMIGLRTVGFPLGLTCLFASAFCYQQYLWRIALPIPAEKLGVALTREAAAASFDEEFALALREGSGDVVVRELPVGFDASDTDEARRLGRRIGADVVLIYREDADDPGGRYVAYVVFTDPDLGWLVGQSSSGEGVSTSRVGAGPEVPIVRAAAVDDVFAVVVAAAAGIVAYHDGNYAQTVVQLERVYAADPDGPNAGLVDFYLGRAHYGLQSNAAAAQVFERGLRRYEGRRAAGERPSPQDLLLIARMARIRGTMAANDGNFDDAIAWNERAAELYRDTTSLESSVVRPEDIRHAFARVFADLADAYRFKQQPDSERRWAARAEEELLAAAAVVRDPGLPRYAAEEADIRLSLGDCVGAQVIAQRALTRDPRSFDANVSAFEIHRAQVQQHLALAQLEHLVAARPEDIRGRLLLAEYLNGGYGINDWPWLARGIGEAEVQLRTVVELQPANAEARRLLAKTLYVSAILRNTAIWPSDVAVDGWTAIREQITGRMTPDQQHTLIDALTAAVDQGTLAVELRPDEAWSHFGLLRIYQERRRALAGLLGVAPLILTDWRGLSQVDAETPSPGLGLESDAELFRADNIEALAEIEWFLTAGSPAPLSHTVEAWYQKLSILGTEWRWLDQSADVPAATAARARYQGAIVSALAFADAIEPDETELANLPVLYRAIRLGAEDLGLRSEAGAAQRGSTRANSALQRTNTEGLNNDYAHVRHWSTQCDEMEEVWKGDDHWQRSAQAQAAYKAALALNPDNVLAQWDYSYLAYRQGDLATAIEWGTKAAHPDPHALGNGVFWLMLGVYHARAGDRAASDAAFDHYFAMMSSLPVWTWAAELDAWGIDQLAFLIDTEAALQRIASDLRPIAERAVDADAAWCAYILSKIGTKLAEEDHYLAAEEALRQSLALEPHQPKARAALALVVLVQGRDATAEIDAAIAEGFDPFWFAGPRGKNEPRFIIREMRNEAHRLLTYYTDKSGLAAPLINALGAAADRAESPPGGSSTDTR